MHASFATLCLTAATLCLTAATLCLMAGGVASAAEGTTWSARTGTGAAVEAFDTDARGPLRVGCTDGRVTLDLGQVTEGTTVVIRFSSASSLVDLGVRRPDGETTRVEVSDPDFAATLLAHDGEELIVKAPTLGTSGLFTFDLTGIADAYATCGLDPAALSRDRSESANSDRVATAGLPPHLVHPPRRLRLDPPTSRLSPRRKRRGASSTARSA